jgi:hypothetical protein
VPAFPSSATVLVVLVVYERCLDQASAWSFLKERLASRASPVTRQSEGFVVDQVLIYDNSPTDQARPAAPVPGLSYVHDRTNGGTAAAYEHGCREACEAGIEWLLLLDHDTVLPPAFMQAAWTAYSERHGAPRALLPWVFHQGTVVSPARVTGTGRIEPLQHRRREPLAKELTGISSGALLHAATLAALLPFPVALWLDYVDHWIFLRLRERAVPVVVFDAFLQHDLSVSNSSRLSTRRLTSVLDGEASFVALLGPLARLFYPVRIFARVFRYGCTRPDLAKHMMLWTLRRLKRSA